MSEAPDEFPRAEQQATARTAVHETAGQRREERRPGARVPTSRARWRYADAVQAARQLAEGTS